MMCGPPLSVNVSIVTETPNVASNIYALRRGLPFAAPMITQDMRNKRRLVGVASLTIASSTRSLLGGAPRLANFKLRCLRG